MKIQLIGSKLTSGQGIGSESVIGKAIVAKTAEEALERAVEGGIFIVKSADKDYLPAIEKSSAIVVKTIIWHFFMPQLLVLLWVFQ